MSFTFGATSAQPASGTTQSGFSFGNTPSSGQSTSLFGNASTAQQPSTGFSFGNTATSQPGTGFGTNTATSQPSFGGFGFGSSTSGAGTTGSLFGSTSQASQPSTGGFGFGTNTATSQPSTGGFGFGTSTATSQPSTSNFSFGNTSSGTGSLFGSANQSSTTGGLFGSANKPATTGGFGGGLFGSTTSSLQQSQQAQTQRAQQVYQLLYEADIEAKRQGLLSSSSTQQYRAQNTWQQLALINSLWDKNSSKCKFRYYFYNLVPPQEVHLYQKPPNHDQKAWDEAQRKNPDPSCLVPALAVSFSDLDKRVEAQKKQKDAQIATLQATEDKLKKLESQNIEREKKIIEIKKRQMDLMQRVLHLIRYVTIIRRKGLSITPLEEQMCASLEHIQDQMQRSEQFHGKLCQLWAQWQLIKESGRKFGKVDGVNGWKEVGTEKLQQMTKMLDELQKAFEHTMQTLEEDEKNIDKIIEQRGRYLH